MRNLFAVLLIIAGVGSWAFVANAAPTVIYQRTLLPETTNTYELGTTTLKWFRVVGSYASTTQVSADSLCLNSDTCRTTWPSGGAGTFSFTPTSYGVATSTTVGFLNGLLSTASTTINASTTITGVLTAPSIYGALTGNASTATALQTARAINGVNFDGTAAITITAASSTLLANSNTFSGTNNFSTLPTLASLSGLVGSNAGALYQISTTSMNASITGLAGTATALAANGANCTAGNYPLGVDASGAVEDCTAAAAGGAFAWTPTTYAGVAVNATSTALWLKATSPFSLIATSTFATYASSTHLTNTGSTWLSSMTSALLLTGADGLIAEYAGAGCTNQVVEDISALGASTCVSIESEQLGDDDWGELTVASGVVTIDDDVLGAEHFADQDWGDITIAEGVASVEDDSHAHTATTISGLGTADISGLDISDDTNLAATWPVLLTGDTLSWGGISTSTVPVANQVAYWSSNSALAGNAAMTFNGSLFTTTNASTTALTVGSYFKLPSTTSFTGFDAGSLAFDTTSGNLLMGTTTGASANVVIASATTTLYAFAMASTSPDFLSGGIVEIPSHFLPQVVTGVICDADAGTSVVINLSDGTNDTNTATCTTTETQFPITTNNTFTAYEDIRLEIGTVTGAVDRLSIRFIGYRTSN